VNADFPLKYRSNFMPSSKVIAANMAKLAATARQKRPGFVNMILSPR
jgi:hypothetical protein